MKCLFCGVDSGPSHIYFCSKKPEGKNRDEIKEEFLLLKFPNIVKESLIKDYEDLMSLTDIRSKYSIDFKACLFLLKRWGVKTRTLKESAEKITVKKSEKTCLERYGTKSTFSKGAISYNKRPIALKEKYGVENSFQIKEVKDRIFSDEFYLERFGMTRRRKKSIEGKAIWASLTKEERRNWIEKSIHKDGVEHHCSNGKISSLEDRIQRVLNKIGIQYTRQLRIKYRGKYYYYDFFFDGFGIVMEINGDYWHANPEKYSPNDMIGHGNSRRLAKEIWTRDENKNNLVRNLGYHFIIIWEDELKLLSDNEVESLLIERLCENDDFNNKYKES